MLEVFKTKRAIDFEKLHAAYMRVEKCEARFVEIATSTQEPESHTHVEDANHKERSCGVEKCVQERNETITVPRIHLNNYPHAVEDSLPSPPPTPVIPQSGLLSDDDFPLSRTPGAADGEDVLNTVLFQHLSPPTLIGVKNQRWVGPSLRRGVLFCGVFASCGPSPV